jgi:2-polyprenyl-3-methyl-5-hydroxy-6-metoxy-1,4-benzoquinol methylase
MAGKVLDVGCGVLPFSNYNIAQNPYVKEAYAIDSNKKAIELLKRYGNPAIKYLQLSAEEMNKLGMQFDRIFCNYSLEHFQDVERFFDNVAKQLKEDGEAFVIEALPSGSNEGSETTLSLSERLGPSFRKLKAQLKAALPQATEEEIDEVMKGYTEPGPPLFLPRVVEVVEKRFSEVSMVIEHPKDFEACFCLWMKR